jgi:hypothetical protein
MNNNISNNLEYCLRAEDTTKGFAHTFPRGFSFLEASYLQGVLHSSSLPDYIEDKKSGGQKTDCLNKNLCNDSTINTGLAGRMIKQMPKTVMRG